MKISALIILLLPFALLGCGGKKNETGTVNRETKQTVADSNKNNQIKNVTADSTANSKTDNKTGERRLRYLFFSKAGLRGFYSDGTIGLCPKCSFTESSVNGMKDGGVFSKYTIEKDGSLLINGNEKQVPAYTGNPRADWAMIDYVWKVSPAK